MSFVVMIHMSPRQPSMLQELLQKVTEVPVSTALDGQAAEPDHIYVIPPNREITMFRGRLQLLEVIGKHSLLPIDHFLKSLALDQGSRSAAVILSGTGTDGTLGAKEIKANEGLVLVQSEASAEYDGMPRSVINSGAADAVLSPQEMPQKLLHYFRRRDLDTEQAPTAAEDRENWLPKIFAILRAKVGHDFSQYKVNTLFRRISRRMGINQIEEHSRYVRFLRENPNEVEALFRELLIGVTSFFRDPESFDALQTVVLPKILERLQPDSTFRVWVPGCSTGEEVYSLAMVIRETLAGNPKRITLQIFGTDIDNYAIEKAREGIFPVNIQAEVNEERLRQFFTREGDIFRIRKEIRDCIVFSLQDLIRDPPFSRLDLLCCRNLLIYLDNTAQKKILPLFHYTLVPEGVMMLGSSETIGGHTNLFYPLDNKWKIYRRREVPQTVHHMVDFPSGVHHPKFVENVPSGASRADQKNTLGQLARMAILDQFSPTAVLVDAKGHILHAQGRSGKYLELPSGPPTQNILDLAREGLKIELSSALREAGSKNHPVVRRRIPVKTNGDFQMIDLHIRPQHAPKELAGRFLVVFRDVKSEPVPDLLPGDKAQLDHESTRISELEKELQSTRESHQTTIEELESSNEELKSTNEELQSSNEELQSTNEELESSKEELQSLNEELQTVNAELQSKVEELSAAHDDMRNLLNSTRIATIFVDNALRIRRFTPEATTIVNLIQSDIGRPLVHVATNLIYENMITDITGVLADLSPREVEVQSTEGDWYKMCVNPYRTIDNRIDGAVLTFISINTQKQARQVQHVSDQEMGQTWTLICSMLDLNEDPLVVLEPEGRIVIANSAFAHLLESLPEEIKGKDLFKFKSRILDQSHAGPDIRTSLKKGEDFKFNVADTADSALGSDFTVKGVVIQKSADSPRWMLLHFTGEH